MSYAGLLGSLQKGKAQTTMWHVQHGQCSNARTKTVMRLADQLPFQEKRHSAGLRAVGMRHSEE